MFHLLVQDNPALDILYNSHTKVEKKKPKNIWHGIVNDADPILFLRWEGVRMEKQMLPHSCLGKKKKEKQRKKRKHN